jgi:hypothetical protein
VCSEHAQTAKDRRQNTGTSIAHGMMHQATIPPRSHRTVTRAAAVKITEHKLRGCICGQWAEAHQGGKGTRHKVVARRSDECGCYRRSKDDEIADRHAMFIVPTMCPASWGAPPFLGEMQAEDVTPPPHEIARCRPPRPCRHGQTFVQSAPRGHSPGRRRVAPATIASRRASE